MSTHARSPMYTVLVTSVANSEDQDEMLHYLVFY